MSGRPIVIILTGPKQPKKRLIDIRRANFILQKLWPLSLELLHLRYTSEFREHVNLRPR